MLIVNSNSFNSLLRIEELRKAERSFEDVVNGNPDAENLREHISDICAALAMYDPRSPTATEDLISLAQFVVSRCFREIQVRYNEDEKVFHGGRLVELLDSWRPTKAENIRDEWITIPSWLRNIFDERPRIKEKEEGTGDGVKFQWKLSRKSLKEWVTVLSAILRELDEAIQRASKERGNGSLRRPSTDQERFEIAEVHNWCFRLHSFVKLKGKGGDVIQSLMDKTSLGPWLSGHMKWHEFYEDYSGDSDDSDFTPAWTRRTTDSTNSERVVDYLRTLTVWHSVFEHLCSKQAIRQAAANLQVGLVEVSPFSSQVCAPEMFVETYLKCYHWRNEPYTQALETIKEHYPQAFTGTIHAEAALLGLLAFVKRGENVNYGGNIQNPRLLHDLLQEAEDVIVVTQKCCWCCAKLAKLVGDRLGLRVKIPGTDGLICAWSPPTVGIHVEVLQKLEEELWYQLRSAISEACESYVSSTGDPESNTPTFFNEVMTTRVGPVPLRKKRA